MPVVPRIVACPTCGTQVEWNPENKYRPFCGERCKLIDLGQWASGAYRVPDVAVSDTAELDADAPDGDAQPPGRA